MAPLVTSSAINKGKTIAPKAVARRRPAAPPKPQQPPQSEQSEQDTVAAAAASQPDTQPATPAPHSQLATPAPQSQPTPLSTQHSFQSSTQLTTESSTQHSTQSSQPPAQNAAPRQSPSTTALLPTPPSTQQHTAQPTSPPQPTPTVEATPSIPAPTPHTTAPTPTPTPQEPPLPSPTPLQSTPVSQSPAPQPEQVAPNVARQPSPSAPIPAQDTQPSQTPTPQSPDQLAGQKRKRPTPAVQPEPAVSHGATAETAPSQSSDAEVALLNGIIAHHEQQRAPTAQMIPRTNPNQPKPRAKRQKKAAPATSTEDNSDEGQAASGAQDEPAPGAAAAKPRKPRAKRKPKSATRIVEDEDGNVIETDEPAVSERSASKPRKPRQKKQKPQQQQGEEGEQGKEGEGGEAGQDDPIDDPENHEIDVTVTTMSDLTRDKGLGKQSERETKMAAIDWDEVYKKRLAEAEAIRAGQDPAAANATATQPTQAGEGENNEETPRPQPAVTGPRLRLDAEGNLVVEEDSLRIDRQAEAARNAANLVVTENDDLTRRVNQMSWINERKRDPTDRVPFFKMKSDPWSEEETDRFYEALRMFGTDFFIISKMFPPKTRRQIKLKFVREERLDPDRINKTLSGEAVPMDLESYAEATGQDLGNFKDPRELDEELRIEGEEQREEIARKKKDIEEAKKQRDIQMAAREKENEERNAQKREKAAMKSNRRKGMFGTGTF